MDDPPIKIPLRNNSNLIKDYNDEVESQLMNLEEEDYPNINSLYECTEELVEYLEH